MFVDFVVESTQELIIIKQFLKILIFFLIRTQSLKIRNQEYIFLRGINENWVGSMVGWFMVLNATFYNISVISWRSVLLVEAPEDNRFPAASHSQTLSHNVCQ
jgi:hypothetical protein